MNNENKNKNSAPKTLTLWINEGTTESYKGIIDGFKEYAPDYAKTTIIIEKKTQDPGQYRTLLLNTMANDGGPDIFQVRQGEDIVLKNQIEPIPTEVIPTEDFEKKYEDIFLSLLYSTWAEKSMKEYLLGVPLWYETLGIYYNKSLLKEVPKTWNELDTLYNNGIDVGIFPSNLGLGPRYTPSISETLALLLGNNKITSYKDMSGNDGVFSSYLFYGTSQIGSKSELTDSAYESKTTLAAMTPTMDTDKTTTLDMFVRGEIGLIFGFPSAIMDLEKAYKRAGAKATSSTILTDRILQDSASWDRKNLARFSYFAISKSSKNGIAAAKFLEYLMTEDAEQRYLKEYPYIIPAQRSFYIAAENTKLSKVFGYVKLGPFIPKSNESLFFFDYGLKTEFDAFLDKYIDRNGYWDISNIWSALSRSIECAVAPYIGRDIPTDCVSKN